MVRVLGSSRFLVSAFTAAATLALWHPAVGTAPPRGVTLSLLGAYDTPFFDQGAVEIAAVDAASSRAFMTFAELPRLDIVDFSNPNNPTMVGMVNLTPWGGDGAHATSVAIHEGLVAAAIPQGDEDTGPGLVVFFDLFGNYINDITVGALPDMLTFTPNGRYVLAANEGQPLDDYSFDPEGSVSIIDMRDGAAGLTQAHVTTADFRAFNAPAPIDPRIRIFGPGASVAQDLEPEYIAVSHDSTTAWVTLQENNALALIDIQSKRVTKLVALGFKDHSTAGNGMDATVDSAVTKDAAGAFKRWPVLGMYQPDAIAALHSKGRTYLFTANEGDVREYGGLGAPKDEDQDVEAIRLEDLTLDPSLLAAYPNLQSANLGIGRLNVTSFLGDTDGDGDYDRLHAHGARSFSVWSEDGALVWDSGDDLERITADRYPANFNASSTSNAIDNRSDDKGPEPEGIAVAKLFGRDYVFVALERIGGVMVYDVTDPTAPAFVQYINARNFGFAPSSPNSLDLGAEGIRVIESHQFGSPLLVVSNEVSGTLRFFRIEQAK